MVFPIIAAVLGGASAVGALASASAGKKAAKAQLQAAQLQIDEQRREYDQSRADMAPWLATGQGALAKLASLYGVTPAGSTATGTTTGPPGDYGGFFTSPGYRFRLDEGMKAVERSAASRGLLRSGAAARAIQRYGEGLASQEYQNFTGRLSELAGTGQSAANSNAAAGQAAVNNINAAYQQQGNARASSYLNTASSINSGINNMMQAFLFAQGGGFGGGGFPKGGGY